MFRKHIRPSSLPHSDLRSHTAPPCFSALVPGFSPFTFFLAGFRAASARFLS